MVRLAVVKKNNPQIFANFLNESPVPHAPVCLNVHVDGVAYHPLAPLSRDPSHRDRILEMAAGLHSTQYTSRIRSGQ